MAVLAALLVFVPCAWTMQLGEHSFLLQNTGEALALALARRDRRPRSPATRPAWALKVLESPAFVAVGAVSYSLFLWHYPVILWLREHGLTAGGLGGLAFNLLLVAVAREACPRSPTTRRAPGAAAQRSRAPRADRRRGTGHDRTRRSASTSRRPRLGQSAVASFRRSLPGVSPASTSMRGSASRSAPRRTVPARTVNATA